MYIINIIIQNCLTLKTGLIKASVNLAITCMHYVLEYRVEYTKIENSYFIL